jgi:hypothetical protein
MAYTVHMADDNECADEIAIDGEDLDEIIEEAEAKCREWASATDWGTDGARVSVRYRIEDEDGEQVARGTVVVDIEPDHEALIAEACRWRRHCGDRPEDHRWTSEGEGGCTSNPGVWATGGTSMEFRSHCRRCGLRRVWSTTGSQYNPGDHDTVSYEMPDDDEIRHMVSLGFCDDSALEFLDDATA